MRIYEKLSRALTLFAHCLLKRFDRPQSKWASSERLAWTKHGKPYTPTKSELDAFFSNLSVNRHHDFEPNRERK